MTFQQQVESAVEKAISVSDDDTPEIDVKRRALKIVVHKRGIVEQGPLQEAAGVIEQVYERTIKGEA